MNGVQWPEGTRVLLDEILTGACGDDEQLWALRQAFEGGVALPAAGAVIGEPVRVVGIDYDGNPRRGLTALCQRPDGREHTVSAADVACPAGSDGARHVAAYRMYLGLDPASPQESVMSERAPRQRTVENDLDLSRPVELVVVAPKARAARCRLVGSTDEITLRSADVWDMVPGEIITVDARKQWRYAGRPYLSGNVEGHCLEGRALGLEPLRLTDEWPWHPSELGPAEDDDLLESWWRGVAARGSRSSFEMEQVLPGADLADPDADPIVVASEMHAAGDRHGAEQRLVELLSADLRCLDAAHLGSFAFDHDPEKAIRHYEAGVRIGELSLGEHFDGLLPWGRIDNRPFLRCLHGFGLCLWRLDRLREAEAVFDRMRWFNPVDNQGIRFILPRVQQGQPWEIYRDDGRRN